MTREEKKIRNEAMRAFKETHTATETAERFGVCEGTVSVICKGIKPQRPRVYHGGSLLKGSLQDEGKIAKRIQSLKNGFEYAGNYTGTDGTVDLRCKKCGAIITRSWVSVRHGSVRCDACENSELQRRQKERAEELAQKKADSDKAAEIRHVLSITKNATQMEMRQCPVCGGMYLATHGRVYCSDRCAKAQNNSIHKDRRIRKIRDVVDDKGITLENVARKDHDVCWICGETVDWSAFYMRGDTFIAEDYYPSIDHVIPLAKGGRHSWDNVRLAHRRCNYLKSDISPVTQSSQ